MSTPTPTKAQMRFLVGLARAGGAMADCTHNVERDAVACLKRGWTLDTGPYSQALTWVGWSVLPRLFEAEAGELAGFTGSTWADYAQRGMVPAADGFAAHPTSGRAARFWWPWTVEAYVTERDANGGSRDGRRVGASQCIWREPGSTGRYGFCRRTLDAAGACPRGHQQAAR